VWLDVGGYFAGRDAEAFRVPAAGGLAEWFEGIIAAHRDAYQLAHFVALVDGEIVGSVSATLHEPVDSAERQLQVDLSRRRLHVDSLGVLAAHRRTGVGSALMRAVEEWGRSRHAEVVILETDAGNEASRRFYEERLGFGVRAVVLRKPLDCAHRAAAWWHHGRVRREWARSIALLLLLPVFFVLLGVGIRACGTGECACPASHAVGSGHLPSR
jgi:ribosomal protein S18 acetylase RimI-like enzyme